MKQFLSILNFEYKSVVKNKTFIISTVVIMLVTAIILSIPFFTDIFKRDEDKSAKDEENKVIVFTETGCDVNEFLPYIRDAFPKSAIVIEETNTDAVKEKINKDEADMGLLIDSDTSYKLIQKNAKMYDQTRYTLDEIFVTKYKLDFMLENGISLEEAKNVLSVTIDSDVIEIGKNQQKNFMYTYILIFALYFTVLMYGQVVITSVVTEKSSRAMEILITSAKPINLMFGKIIGAAFAGITQIVAILGTCLVFYQINRPYLKDNPIAQSVFGMPISMMLYVLLFFVLGFFLYAFMFGAMGSLASRLEDTNTLVTPVMLLFVGAFFVVMFSISSGNVESTLMKVVSYIPFTSPMAMFARIAMGDPSAIEVIVSVAILIGFTCLIGWVSAKIYRIGILLYGNPPKPKEIIKALKQN